VALRLPGVAVGALVVGDTGGRVGTGGVRAAVRVSPPRINEAKSPAQIKKGIAGSTVWVTHGDR
jgi:hypothetical protein